MSVGVSTFHRLFAGSIRVALAWERVPADTPVTIVTAAEKSEFRDWYSPWYVADGRECGYDAPGAQPLSILAAGGGSAPLSRERQASIEGVMAELAALRDPRDVVVATYALGEGRQLVLDGNHRLAALVHLGGRFRVVGLCLMGPVDRRVLPDLMHWDAPVGPG